MYGTSRDYVTGQLVEGRHVILDIDVQGALAVMRSGLPMVTIFMIPPDPGDVERTGSRSAEPIRKKRSGCGWRTRKWKWST